MQSTAKLQSLRFKVSNRHTQVLLIQIKGHALAYQSSIGHLIWIHRSEFTGLDLWNAVHSHAYEWKSTGRNVVWPALYWNTHLMAQIQAHREEKHSLWYRDTHVLCLFGHSVCVLSVFISHSASVFVLLPYCSDAYNSSNCESAQQTYTTPDFKAFTGFIEMSY